MLATGNVCSNLTKTYFYSLSEEIVDLSSEVYHRKSVTAAQPRHNLVSIYYTPPMRCYLMLNVRFSSLCCSLLAFVVVAAATLQPATACTRILWNDNGLAVVVGRTMDWPESTQPVLTVFPRGMERNGGFTGTELTVKENPAK